MNILSVTDLLIEELADLYDAELRLVAALPKLAESGISEDAAEVDQELLQESNASK